MEVANLFDLPYDIVIYIVAEDSRYVYSIETVEVKSSDEVITKLKEIKSDLNLVKAYTTKQEAENYVKRDIKSILVYEVSSFADGDISDLIVNLLNHFPDLYNTLDKYGSTRLYGLSGLDKITRILKILSKAAFKGEGDISVEKDRFTYTDHEAYTISFAIKNEQANTCSSFKIGIEVSPNTIAYHNLIEKLNFKVMRNQTVASYVDELQHEQWHD